MSVICKIGIEPARPNAGFYRDLHTRVQKTMDSRPILLIVEDDICQQKVLRLLAERYGYDALFVGTGTEAINALNTCDTCFDAILMDWKMPQMNGIECTKQIRALEFSKGRHTPIIAVTAYASESDRRQCLDAGMDDYLSKPFDMEEFRRILLKWTFSPGRPNLKILPGGGREEVSA